MEAPPPLSPPPPDSSSSPPPPPKLRLMCSYGGRIVPRPHDKTLCYVGGDTRLVAVDRRAPLSDLLRRLSKTLPPHHHLPFSLKYQLPNEDLDSLISLSTDEDLDNMADEHDRLSASTGRLRLFIFPKTTPSSEPDDSFFSESSSVNCLLGLDDDYYAAAKTKDIEAQIEGLKIGDNNGNHVITANQEVHSIPDSPMLETSSSSFDSTSSSPSLANLAPIRVRADENNQLMNANLPLPPLKQVEVGVFADDERSDHGGYRKVQPVMQQVQPHHQIPQFQPKPNIAFDLPSPDSVSSEGSITNPLSRQRQAIYQEPLIQIQSANTQISSNQFDLKTIDLQESGYVIPANHPQLHHPQQFVHAANQYIPPGAMPVGSYYSIYPPQQQPLYLVSNRQNQAYNLPLQQPGYTEAGQTRNIPSSKPEMASGVYRQLVQPQYVGYTQVHQPSYEFSDPNHGNVYYKPLPPQYQMLMSSASPGMVVHDASLQVPVENLNIKQQVRS